MTTILRGRGLPDLAEDTRHLNLVGDALPDPGLLLEVELRLGGGLCCLNASRKSTDLSSSSGHSQIVFQDHPSVHPLTECKFDYSINVLSDDPVLKILRQVGIRLSAVRLSRR